jgi:hypothetical protein
MIRKFCSVATIAMLTVAIPAHAAPNDASGTFFYPSCMAAADIMEGRPAPAEPDTATAALNNAAMCLGAVTAIMHLEPFLKSEFAMCPPKDSKISYAQMVLAVAAYLKAHPEQLNKSFHALAVFALRSAWPCSQ